MPPPLRSASVAVALATLLATALLPSACGRSTPTSPTSASGSANSAPGSALTVSPIDPGLIDFIVPLGNLGPTAHTLPTDHIYFYWHGPEPSPLVAPAAGTVENVISTGNDGKLVVRVNSTFVYYLDHVTFAPGIGVGTRVQAGQVVGSSARLAFDLGVHNFSAAPLGFVNPVRYGGLNSYSIYSDAPLKFFAEPLRSLLYSKVRSDGVNPDGRINFDVDGTLSGGWFREDLPATAIQDGSVSTGSRQLAFARDNWFSDRQRISIGGFGMTGVYGVPPDATDFASVTPASGRVTYRLLYTGEPGGPPTPLQAGLLIVEMLDGRRIRVEAFQTQASTGTFSERAEIYLR